MNPADAWLKWLDDNMDPDLKVFSGPCAHGRVPYTRCDECGELPPEQARAKAALEAELRLRQS